MFWSPFSHLNLYLGSFLILVFQLCSLMIMMPSFMSFFTSMASLNKTTACS